MSIHAERTHPEFHEDCFLCRIATVQVDHQSLSTRDHVRNNMGRTNRILADRAEKRDALTDLRYGRRRSAQSEESVVTAPNLDGIAPRHP